MLFVVDRPFSGMYDNDDGLGVNLDLVQDCLLWLLLHICREEDDEKGIEKKEWGRRKGHNGQFSPKSYV